jgi:hypothetical protein
LTLLAMIVVVAASYWIRFEIGRKRDAPATVRLMIGRAFYFFLLICLPLWLWVVMHGIVRNAVAGPSLAVLQVPARLQSYHERTGRRGAAHDWVVVETDAFGKLRIEVPRLISSDQPEAGSAVTVVGRRTWVGDFYTSVLF